MKDRLIVITGPTASGKSDIAINLAKSLDSMIISADSQQVYRYMDIGTNKINDVFDVDHFMLNIVDPNEEFSVEDFSKEAKSLVKKINQNMRIPIVTGGTGFYIDSLIFDMNYGRVEKNQAYRDELQQVAQEKGNEYLYKKLESLDPETSKRYHHNEVNRVIRALEIYKVSGDIPSKIRTGERRLNDKVDPLVFFLNYDNRDILYNRINQRVLEMVNMGLVDEVRDLTYRFKLDSKSQSMSAIGYKEVLKYIDIKHHFNHYNEYKNIVKIIMNKRIAE